MPAFKPSQTFPGVDRLPQAGRSILEFFFPQIHPQPATLSDVAGKGDGLLRTMLNRTQEGGR